MSPGPTGKSDTVQPHAPLRVAMVGGSKTSAVGRVHQLALTMDRRYDVVAGCFSRDSEDARETALAYGVPLDRTYLDLEELLSRERDALDAIIILTPTDQHRAHVSASLESGLPVVCEKALGVNSAEVLAIKETLSATQGYLSVVYNYLGYPMLRELRRLVQSGSLGRIGQIHLEMPQEGFRRLTLGTDEAIVPQAWRLREGAVPMVSLDLGVHLHMITRFLTGERPLEVSAVSNTFGNFDHIVDNVICIARYTNDLVSNVWYGKVALGCRNGLKVRVFGDQGSAEWYQETPENLTLSDVYGRRYSLDRGDARVQEANLPRYTRFKAGHPAGFIEAFANYYGDVADGIAAHLAGQRAANQYVYGIDEALEGLCFLEAIATASKSGSWVDIERQ